MKINSESVIEIITIGSELLTPYSSDSNSLYLAQRLNDLGLEVSYKTTVGDDWQTLLRAVKESLARAHLIIATGGLGPTHDDITREVFAKALGRELLLKRELLTRIRERFKRRGLVMPANNKKQAYIIQGAEVLENRRGTAAGMWLDTGLQIIILFPGPPQELKPMFEEAALPLLREMAACHLFRKVLKMADTTESEVESRIQDLYPRHPEVKVTTLAFPGQIEVHLRASSEKSIEDAEKKVGRVEKKILGRLGEKTFSTGGEELEQVVGNLLLSQKKTLAVAESCTGGLLSNRITNVPGSSEYFLQGIVVYSNEAKVRHLGVKPALIQKYGAVSSQVARAMAVGIKRRASSSYGLGITGIAGPTGGTPQKPVGLVYIALAAGREVECIERIFLGSRETIKFQSTQKALDMLRRRLQRKMKTQE